MDLIIQNLGLLINAALIATPPLLLAALGSCFSERSGVVNIGIEGMMTMGAVTGAIAALVTGNGVLDKESVNGILKLLGVDENGLDELDRNILKSIITVYNGGPVGIETLSLLLGEDRRTIEEVYEPYLVKIGFIKRTQRGRIVTEHGYRHLGLEKSLSGKEDVENDYENKLF